MSGSVGFGNDPTNINFSPPSTDSTKSKADAPLPRIDQGVRDQLIQSDGTAPVPPIPGYVATLQFPQLTKPKIAETVAKFPTTTSKESSKDADKVSSEQGDQGSNVHFETEAVVEYETQESHQEQEGEGQGGGGQQGFSGGSSGGGSSSSGGGGFDFQGKQTTFTELETQQPRTASSTRRTASTNIQTDTSLSSGVTSANLQGTTNVTSITSVDANQLKSPPENPMQFLQNAQLLMQEMYKLQVETVNAMPDGPEKMRFIDFLQKVSEALIALQQFMYSLQNEESKGARDRSQAQLETALYKIELQQREQKRIEEMRKEQDSKQKTLNPINKTLGSMGLVMSSAMVLSFAPLLLASGPVGWLFLSIMILSVVSNGMKLDNQDVAFPWVMDKLNSVCDEIAEKLIAYLMKETLGYEMSKHDIAIASLATRWTAVASICTLCLLANPAVFAFGGSASLVEFFQNSKVISDSAKMNGESDKVAMEAEIYTCLSLSVLSMILGIGVSVVAGPMGASAGASGVMNAGNNLARSAAQTAVNMLQQAIKISDRTARIATEVLTAILKILTNPQLYLAGSTLALKGVQTKLTVDLHYLIAELKMVQARLEKEVEASDALIAILKKIIQKLLETLEGLTKETANISSILQKNKEQLSEVLTNLFG